MIQAGGIMKNGVFGYFKGLIPPGVPVFLLPVMFVIEFLGLFTKPFALAIRLFANMTAGHIVILALLGLIFILKTFLIAPVSIAFALFIYSLEILVSLLQAYIFTMLSSLFIGMAVHQEH
jgi:F-type H+-transporting ATPase subunit a